MIDYITSDWFIFGLFVGFFIMLIKKIINMKEFDTFVVHLKRPLYWLQRKVQFIIFCMLFLCN